MKKNTIAFLCLLLFLISSCADESRGIEETEDGQTVTVTVVVAKDNPALNALFGNSEPVIAGDSLPNGATTRVAVTEDTEPRFQWRVGEKIPLHLLVRANAIIQTYVTLQTELIVTAATPAGATGRFSFKLPVGLSLGVAQLAAVTGKQPGVENGAWATGWSSPGVAAIQSSSTINMGNLLDGNTNVQYNIPLFFGLKTIPQNGELTASFGMYGSLVGFQITNSTSVSKSPAFVQVNTQQFSTGGNANFTSLSNGFPTWTSDGVAERRFTIQNLTVAPNQTRIAWIWAKQIGTTPRDIGLYYKDGQTNITYLKPPNRVFTDGMAYRMLMPVSGLSIGTLMFTEFYLNSNRTKSYLELFNPAIEDDDGGYPSRLTQSGYTIERTNAAGVHQQTWSIASGGGLMEDDWAGRGYTNAGWLWPVTPIYTSQASVNSMQVYGASTNPTNRASLEHPGRLTGRYTRPSNTTVFDAQPGDFFYLKKDGLTIDVMKVGSTNNRSIRRNKDINSPNPIYNANEWKDNMDPGLGRRNDDPAVTP